MSESALCSPCFPANNTIPEPWISTREPSPNRTVTLTARSSLEKTSLRPVMWLVAPVSRYQPSWSSPASALPRNAWAHSSLRWTVVDAGSGASFNAQTCAISSAGSSSSSCARCA
uniref:Uncharacterized protein n=1 Tax=Arundo donax TaxID=35708 RepID=A0A0A9HHG6_ARUDO